MEVCALFTEWRAHGKCSFNQSRLDYWIGSRQRADLVTFLNELESEGMTSKVGGACKGVRSIQREFSIRGVKSKNPGFVACNSNDSLVAPGNAKWVSVRLSEAVLETRSAKWVDWCKANQQDLKLDAIGATAWGRATHKGLQAMRLPEDISGIDMSDLDDDSRAWLEHYMANRHEGLSPVVALKRWRLYHALSNCPKLLRERAQFFHNGQWEAATAVDIHAAYWCILTSRLPESEEKASLVGLLQSRAFYARLAAECGVEPTSDFKIEVQKQALFWPKGWALADRPVAQALAKLFPKLYAYICRMRRKYGVGGLSDKLMHTEASIIVHGALIEASEHCPCISLHDALLCPASEAERVQAIIIKHAMRVLGFAGAVKIG